MQLRARVGDALDMLSFQCLTFIVDDCREATPTARIK
jgi:hypothetical protein